MRSAARYNARREAIACRRPAAHLRQATYQGCGQTELLPVAMIAASPGGFSICPAER
jgi:hypothetical protein